VTHYSQAIEQGTGDIWGVWYPLALLHLSAGRADEYRRLCEQLLARFGQSNNPDFWLVATCKLAPDAVADPSQPVRIAEKLLDRDPDNADLAGVLGETLYRQGDVNAAVQKLEASIHAAPGVGVQWRKLYLAMAYHRQGRTADAQQLLMEATQWVDANAGEKLAEGAELHQPLQWCQRTELQLLHLEAQELLSKKD
jgi:predicted Zn-dependent protease